MYIHSLERLCGARLSEKHSLHGAIETYLIHYTDILNLCPSSSIYSVLSTVVHEERKMRFLGLL